MAKVSLDTVGLRCPHPVLKITVKMPELSAGDILEVRGDCPTFEEDVRKWCERMKKTLLAVTLEGTVKVAKIQI